MVCTYIKANAYKKGCADTFSGRRFPNGPHGPRRPRPDRGGPGAVFEENARRAAEPSRPYDGDAAHARPATDSRWSAYEPSAQPRYEASPPAPRATSHLDLRPQASWSAPAHETMYASGRASAGGYTYMPPRLGGQGQCESTQANAARPHVSFQESGNAGESTGRT